MTRDAEEWISDLAMAALIVLSPFIWGTFIWWELGR